MLVLMILNSQRNMLLTNLIMSLSLSLSSFDHGLEKFGVDLEELNDDSPKRIIRAWMEDWEEEAIGDDDVVSEQRILAKYKNLSFYDLDSIQIQPSLLGRISCNGTVRIRGGGY